MSKGSTSGPRCLAGTRSLSFGNTYFLNNGYKKSSTPCDDLSFLCVRYLKRLNHMLHLKLENGLLFKFKIIYSIRTLSDIYER